MKEEQIKIVVSAGSIKYEITLEKWGINSNTKDFLIEKTTEYINEIFEGVFDEQRR